MFKTLFLFFLSLTTMFSFLLADHNATYVGDRACVACHAREFQEWKLSDHAKSMMVADENSVKADFNNTTFNYHGMISTFYRKNGKFMVHTEGPDGKLHDYEIAYTFGIYPLQQYLIKFPKGRIQVLDPTWDSRSKSEGGQRWYHIHADENITAGDVLHWTGPNMNWNYMCADCHSTNLKKNYNEKNHSYHTTWSSINVSCEACHGPASEHLKWTKDRERNVSNKGFPISFKDLEGRGRDGMVHSRAVADREIELCAKCHSRRTPLDDDFTPGDRFTDHYLPVLLEENLYFPDGKIEDEVYVYDSFLQSKMYAKGVTCTDCHNPHTLKRKAKGDKVCFQCHAEKKYTASSHHKHKMGGPGSSCVSCHMPARTYMGVDSRNDHSFRIPRPDISVEMKEVPNACNLCHRDKGAKWAAEAVKRWYGKTPIGKQNFAHALQALRTNAKEAPAKLYDVLASDAPGIAKATVASYLGQYPSRQTYMTTLQLMRYSDPKIRRAALQSLEAFPPKLRMKQTVEMLKDSSRIVRIEAARQLSAFPTDEWDAATKKLLDKAFDEYEKTLLFSAERPESQLSLGTFYMNRGRLGKAEQAYREALRLQPKFVPAYVNYSHFLMKEGKNEEARRLLERGISLLPDVGVLHHALGLWYVRNHQPDKGLEALRKAMELSPDNARFAYVYAVALGKKDPRQAIRVLEKAYKNHSGDMSIVSALGYYNKQIGNQKKAEIYEEKLRELKNRSVH